MCPGITVFFVFFFSEKKKVMGKRWENGSWNHELSSTNPMSDDNTGWWFGCHQFYVPINILGCDYHPNWRTLIFFRGVADPNHQPVMFHIKLWDRGHFSRPDTTGGRSRATSVPMRRAGSWAWAGMLGVTSMGHARCHILLGSLVNNG